MPHPTQLLIIGGGPAALEAALAVQHLAAERVRITLLSDRDEFVYRPVAVAEPFGFAAAERFSLARIAAERGFERRLGVLDSVEPDARRVLLADGEHVEYDVLLLALGARGEDAIPGALTFRGPEDVARLRERLEHLHRGAPLRIAFAAAPETAWTLPLYELALLTARWAREHRLALEPWVITHEHRPLSLFGTDAAVSVAELLTDEGVRLWTGAHAETYDHGKLWVSREGGLPADLAVALPRLAGPRVRGIPMDADGFVPVDGHGRVNGLDNVYAAGDMTSRALKQGGLATQQADAAAAAIAATAGADVRADAYRPVLRAMLLTGGRPRYLRRSAGSQSAASDDAPYLTAHPELQLQSS